MTPQDAERFKQIFLLMTDEETRSAIFAFRRVYRNFVTDLGNRLSVPNMPSWEYGKINTLQKFFSDLREANDDKTFECLGCGGLSEATGLRWDKLNKGLPITVSVDHSNKPYALRWLTNQEIMDNWFKPWTEINPKIKFELLRSGRGDSHITFEPVDGPGNTLKFVWQPTQTEIMDEGPELVGNMVCDNTETYYPRVLVHEAGKHEVGHVLGIGHLNDQRDVMYPTARGEFKILSVNDKREANERYPYGSNGSTVAT